LLALLAIANSLAFRQMVDLQMAFGSYEVGVIQRTPVPVLTPEGTQYLATLAHRAWSLKYSIDTVSETSHAFRLPALRQVPGERLTARALAWAERVRESNAKLVRIQTEIDEYVFDLYGIYGPDREKMLETVHEVDGGGADTDYDDEDNEELTPVDATELVAQLLSYGMGLAFNRFDVALALDGRLLPHEPDPFAPLPVCSPVMLVQANGLSAEPRDISGDYPLRIAWSGILVDDDGHADDIIGGIRHALEVIWPITASEIEQEACDLLGDRYEITSPDPTAFLLTTSNATSRAAARHHSTGHFRPRRAPIQCGCIIIGSPIRHSTPSSTATSNPRSRMCSGGWCVLKKTYQPPQEQKRHGYATHYMHIASYWTSCRI
jgi:hypothetical protein